MRAATGPKAARVASWPAPTGRLDLAAEAVVFEGDGRVAVKTLTLAPPSVEDAVVDVEWSGISTGTERLMWSGRMPPFPGMGYPLVPGYEAVGRVVRADSRPDLVGRRVFAPGSRGFEGARGLFGAAASRIVLPAARLAPIDESLGERGLLLALAATAQHALAGGSPPDLIVGHGVLGRLLARLAMAQGAAAPVVWEIAPERCDADGYAVIEPDDDGRTDYRSIYDASGDSEILDPLIARMAPRGEIVLAGFYTTRPSFDFPRAFMKEARVRIAAEWSPEDLETVVALIGDGRLSLDGLVTHRATPAHAADAYRTAFEDLTCLKMAIDWRDLHE